MLLVTCFVDTFVVPDEDAEVVCAACTASLSVYTHSLSDTSNAEFTADSTARRRSVVVDNDAGDGPCKAAGLPSLS